MSQSAICAKRNYMQAILFLLPLDRTGHTWARVHAGRVRGCFAKMDQSDR